MAAVQPPITITIAAIAIEALGRRRTWVRMPIPTPADEVLENPYVLGCLCVSEGCADVD